MFLVWETYSLSPSCQLRSKHKDAGMQGTGYTDKVPFLQETSHRQLILCRSSPLKYTKRWPRYRSQILKEDLSPSVSSLSLPPETSEGSHNVHTPG